VKIPQAVTFYHSYTEFYRKILFFFTFSSKKNAPFLGTPKTPFKSLFLLK